MEAEYNGNLELKDLKYSKYKEQACDRCRQIAEDLDSIEKTGDVQKSKTDEEKLLDNEKSIRINETNSINSSKNIGMISISVPLFSPFQFIERKRTKNPHKN